MEGRSLSMLMERKALSVTLGIWRDLVLGQWNDFQASLKVIFHSAVEFGGWWPKLQFLGSDFTFNLGLKQL